MLGDAVDDALALAGVRWLHEQQIAVLAMAPAKKDYGHHNLPLERFGTALRWLKVRGHKQIGIFGISTTGMLALIAASYYPEISLTIAASPSDFVMEGFYRGHRDGATEWPSSTMLNASIRCGKKHASKSNASAEKSSASVPKTTLCGTPVATSVVCRHASPSIHTPARLKHCSIPTARTSFSHNQWFKICSL